jgi:proteasome lid subunit RPN8/RPN11
MNISSSRNLSLSSAHIEQMQRHVEDCHPEEGCGILGGFNDRVEWVIPITNILHSSTRFRMDPQEQVDAFFKIEEAGGKLIGIYHSHPTGPEFPSDSDIRSSALPEAVHIIWHPLDEEWNYQAYRIDPVVGYIAVGISMHGP